MRKINILGLIFTLIMMFSGCEKDKDPAGLRGKAVIPIISNINPAIFDSRDLEHSYVEFKVDVPAGTHSDKIVIQGSYQSNHERIALKELTSFPATVRILSSDVAQKLGITLADISNGAVFTLELITTANGTTTRSGAVLFIPVACAYDVNLATGSYHAVSDWPSENDVTITSDANDPYTVYVLGLATIDDIVEDLGPFVMHINPINYEVTTEPKLLASDYFGYGGVTYSGSGTYSSCDGSFTLNIDISIGNFGSQGIYQFNITRNSK
jgi:hypothetical protein